MSISEQFSIDEQGGDFAGMALSPVNNSLSVARLSGAQKAAILCIALGDDAAGEILRYLTEDEVQQVSRELASIPHVSPELADVVVKEFHDLFIAQAYVASAGLDFAKRLLVKSLGPESAKRMLDKVAR